ncbi:MAG TPA: MFS transporter [Longimicrobiales bacterium]|nr:MFS transporter [Longimicrobiales bacterium]
MASEQTSGLGNLLGRAAKVEPGEGTAVVTSFLLYFFVLGGYFAVRPVRETVGTILGPDRTADLFVWTWVASLAIVPVYGALCARFRRSAFLPWIYGFVAVSLALVGLTFQGARPSLAAAYFFWIMISVLNLFMVSVFWSFLLELFDPTQTQRLFGILAAGGTAGALGGPILTDLTVRFIGNDGVLFMGAAMFLGAIVCQRVLIRIWKRADWGKQGGAPPDDRPMGGNPFAGFTLILRSPYLLGIALFVVLLASVNTFLYFAQLRIVTDTFADVEVRTQVFSRLDYTVQTLTIIAQLLLTGRIATRWGIGSLLTVVPLAMVGGLLLLSAVHTFAVLALVIIARRVGEYAFVRPGREMLFSRLDTETKYKAKNAIDVPVYRGGDALVAQVDSALSNSGMSAASLAAVGAGVAAAWALNGWMLGKSRRARGVGQPAGEPAPAAQV